MLVKQKIEKNDRSTLIWVYNKYNCDDKRSVYPRSETRKPAKKWTGNFVTFAT